MENKLEIPYKLPSLNDYVYECRSNKFAGAKMKAQVEKDISWYINTLPTYNKPIKIHFHWIEGNKRRDYDNICFAKKFILDCMVKCHKLKNDNRNWVTGGFVDTFEYGDTTKVILKISEISE